MRSVLSLSVLALSGVLACSGEAPELEPSDQAGVSIPDGRGTQFAVYSAHATRIELWLFAAAADEDPISVHVLDRGADDMWRAYVPGVGPGALYGFRAWGPNYEYHPDWTPGSLLGFKSHADARGNRFNPNKLLLDPYARAITGDVRRVRNMVTGEAQYDPAILGGTDEYGFRDSAAAMPKSVVVDEDFRWGADHAPSTPPHESVVYEVHLRGFTKQDPDLPLELRGTYDGFATKARYLRDLGVTAVELLPVQDFLRFAGPVAGEAKDRPNYWGYMTHGFFAPHRAYLCTEPDACPQDPGAEVAAFKRLVSALHDEGIEVWMDVVYNHTGEGGACAGVAVPYLNFRGLDNASYYTLADDPACYWDSTGTGNNLNAARPAVQRLVLDSLRYWIEQMHVDGFRFDLAYTLGRYHGDGRWFDSQAPLLRAIAELGRETGVKMVAEAWDTQGYGVGQFPDGWMEWNGIWRDNVRQFVKSDADQIGALGASISASHYGLPPAQSVNFVTAHDGFTLEDLVTYEHKNNGYGACNPDGLDPNSGSDDDDAWDTDGDPILRAQQLRNFVTHLATSQGVPMLLAGDEMRRSQEGNNNGYMADNSCGWIDWYDVERNAGHHDFTRGMLALRAAHPALGRALPLTGSDHDGDGLPDIAWHGTWPEWPDWGSSSRSLAFTLDGSPAETGGWRAAPDLYVAHNAYWRGLTFHLPNPPPGQCWFLAADTAAWAEPAGNVFFDGVDWDAASLFPVEESYFVSPRSAVVLAARRCDAPAPGRVDFEVRGYRTRPGESLAVVGSTEELGSWDPTRAVPLGWASADTWRGSHFFSLRLGQEVRFKFVRLFEGRIVAWEGGADRALTLPAAGEATSARGDWR